MHIGDAEFQAVLLLVLDLFIDNKEQEASSVWDLDYTLFQKIQWKSRSRKASKKCNGLVSNFGALLFIQVDPAAIHICIFYVLCYV